MARHIKHTFTVSELKAYKLMTQQNMITTDLSFNDMRDEISNFMLLAEKIKNERAIVSMQK